MLTQYFAEKIVSCTPYFRYPLPQVQYARIDHCHTEQQLTNMYMNPNHIIYSTII